MHRKVPPSSTGLLRALQSLAEESALLGLKYTSMALQHAIETCLLETDDPTTTGVTVAAAELVH